MKNIAKRIFCFVLAAVLLCSAVAVSAENIDEAWDVGENYVFYGQYVTVGEGEYTLSELYDYTIFAFCPDETGRYVFTSDNAQIGIVSYNAMWVSIQPDESTIASSTIEWECTGVGQEIWIAAISDSAAASIEVKAEASQKVVVEKIVYTNNTTPAPFEFGGDPALLTSVNVRNNTIDTAVLGDDGYYHLNSKDGYILYANISDSQMSLSGATSYGQLKGAEYDDEGNLIAIIDYNTAFLEYEACADTATYLYPLTDDLIEMFKEVGSNLGWYGEGGWLGYSKDDAWMFACYYTTENITPAPNSYTVTVNGVAVSAKAGETITISAEAFKVENNNYYRFIAWTGDFDGIADTAAAETTVVVNGDITIEAEYLMIGDITGDGKLNAMDTNIMRRMASGQVASVAAADIDGDGKVLPNDSNLLSRLVSGSWAPTK